VQLVIVF